MILEEQTNGLQGVQLEIWCSANACCGLKTTISYFPLKFCFFFFVLLISRHKLDNTLPFIISSSRPIIIVPSNILTRRYSNMPTTENRPFLHEMSAPSLMSQAFRYRRAASEDSNYTAQQQSARFLFRIEIQRVLPPAPLIKNAEPTSGCLQFNQLLC